MRQCMGGRRHTAIAWIAFLVCVLAAVPLFGAEAPDKKKPARPKCTGFRGIKWGQEAKSVRGLKFDYKDDGLEHHRRKTDQMMIGDADLSGIVYTFYTGRLVRVMITIRSVHDAVKVKAVLAARYGPPKKLKPEHGEPQKWEWTAGDGRITLTEGRKYSHGIVKPALRMESVPLLEQKKKDDADAAAQGAARDL